MWLVAFVCVVLTGGGFGVLMLGAGCGCWVVVWFGVIWLLFGWWICVYMYCFLWCYWLLLRFACLLVCVSCANVTFMFVV